MEDIRKCFEKLCNLWDKPETDLFATRLNSKLTKYKSWKTDARSASIDVSLYHGITVIVTVSLHLA